MYDELMAEINEGRYKTVAAADGNFYCAVATGGHYLEVCSDGRCRINGRLDPDAPDFLRAIIYRQLRYDPDDCLPMYDDLMSAIAERRYHGPTPLDRAYMIVTTRGRVKLYPTGEYFLYGRRVGRCPGMFQAIIDAEHRAALGRLTGELMAEINNGEYYGPFMAKGYYLVYVGRDCLEVHPDGGCCFNGMYDPDAANFLQAIIEKCHEKALEMNDVR